MGYIRNNESEHLMCGQKHVHELQGSVKIVEREEDPHNHRFATVTGEAIPCGGDDHVHDVTFRTDFYEDHFHEFKGRTGGAIQVGNRHVHFIESITSVNDCHKHCFEASTLIENPIGEEYKKEDCDHNEDPIYDNMKDHMYDNIHNNMHDNMRMHNNMRRNNFYKR